MLIQIAFHFCTITKNSVVRFIKNSAITLFRAESLNLCVASFILFIVLRTLFLIKLRCFSQPDLSVFQNRTSEVLFFFDNTINAL